MNAGHRTILLLILLAVAMALVGRYADSRRTTAEHEINLGLCPFCGRGQ